MCGPPSDACHLKSSQSEFLQMMVNDTSHVINICILLMTCTIIYCLSQDYILLQKWKEIFDVYVLLLQIELLNLK